jgi:TPR repeat protein
VARNTTKRRFPSLGRFWQKYLHEAIYVPIAAEPRLRTLIDGGFSAFPQELERLASLGTPWASAWLAYAALKKTQEGVRDITRAIELCSTPAQRGDPLAQYILAWALMLNGDTLRGAQYMKRAAKQGFPGAVLDSVTLFWRGWGVLRADDRRILRLLDFADRVGHDAAWTWRFAIYRTGKLGTYRRILGYMFAPVGIVRYFLAKKLRPFSAEVFVFDPARYLIEAAPNHNSQRP